MTIPDELRLQAINQLANDFNHNLSKGGHFISEKTVIRGAETHYEFLVIEAKIALSANQSDEAVRNALMLQGVEYETAKEIVSALTQ